MFDTVIGRRVDLARLLAADARRSGEMQELFDWILEQDRDMPPLDTLPVVEARRWRARQALRTNADLPEMAAVMRLSVPCIHAAPPVACELVTPRDVRPGCLVFLHGGGWAFGDLESHARLARLLGIETRLRVLYVDYRLAPEHPFPAALEDAAAAWRWAVDKAARSPEFAGPLAICGDSAGGNLAVAAMLHEMQAGRRIPDFGMSLYGVFADDFDSPSYRRFASGYGLTRAGMMKFFDLYAPPDTPGGPRHEPLVCPVKASESELARLPPMYLNASHLDPLLCDTIAFANRLEASGATVTVNIHEGMQHGFMQQTARLAEARRAFGLMGDFVRQLV